MCELLIRIRDKANRADPYLDAKCLKRGDVVAVVPDGWKWGREELKNPDWRILQLPNVSVEEAQAFLGPEYNEDPENPSRVLQRRAFKFDVDSHGLPQIVKRWMNDDSRMMPSMSMGFNMASMSSLRVRKKKLRDPNVLE